MGKNQKILLITYLVCSSVLLLLFQNCGNIVLTGSANSNQETPAAVLPPQMPPATQTPINTGITLTEGATAKPITGSTDGTVVAVNENIPCEKTAVYTVTERQLFSSSAFEVSDALKDTSLLRGSMVAGFSTSPVSYSNNYHVQISNVAEKIDVTKSFPQDCVFTKGSAILRYVSHKFAGNSLELGPNGEIKFCKLPPPAGKINNLDYWFINVKVESSSNTCSSFSYNFSLPGEAVPLPPAKKTLAKNCINSQAYESWMDNPYGFKSPGHFGLAINVIPNINSIVTEYVPHPNEPSILVKNLNIPNSTAWSFKASYQKLFRNSESIQNSFASARLNPNAATSHGPWLPSGGSYLFNISDEPCGFYSEPRAFQCQTPDELKLKNPQARGYFDELSTGGGNARAVCHLGKPAGWEGGEPYWYVNFMPTASLRFWGFTTGGNGYFPRLELDPR